MLLALSRSVAEFEPRRHLADGGSTTRPAGLEEVARAFRLSTRPAQTRKPGGGACDTHNRTQLYSKCRCACRRHQRCHCGERRLRNVAVFWAALGPAAAGTYMVTWGARGSSTMAGPELIKCGAFCQGPARQKGGHCAAFPRVAKADQDNIASSGPECGDEAGWVVPRSREAPGDHEHLAFPPGRNKVLGA
jgi:hypothetical protein